MKLRIASLSLLALCLAVVPAVAQTDLYDNGPTNGTVDAWTINFGFIVSDSFTLGSRLHGHRPELLRMAVPGRRSGVR